MKASILVLLLILAAGFCSGVFANDELQAIRAELDVLRQQKTQVLNEQADLKTKEAYVARIIALRERILALTEAVTAPEPPPSVRKLDETKLYALPTRVAEALDAQLGALGLVPGRKAPYWWGDNQRILFVDLRHGAKGRRFIEKHVPLLKLEGKRKERRFVDSGKTYPVYGSTPLVQIQLGWGSIPDVEIRGKAEHETMWLRHYIKQHELYGEVKATERLKGKARQVLKRVTVAGYPAKIRIKTLSGPFAIPIKRYKKYYFHDLGSISQPVEVYARYDVEIPSAKPMHLKMHVRTESSPGANNPVDEGLVTRLLQIVGDTVREQLTLAVVE